MLLPTVTLRVAVILRPSTSSVSSAVKSSKFQTFRANWVLSNQTSVR